MRDNQAIKLPALGVRGVRGEEGSGIIEKKEGSGPLSFCLLPNSLWKEELSLFRTEEVERHVTGRKVCGGVNVYWILRAQSSNGSSRYTLP